MHKNYLVTGARLGALAVALGAFGAHGLQKIVSEEKIIQSFRTGVQYHQFHALALIATAIIYSQFSNSLVKSAGAFFLAGIVLFSGSLYLITLLQIKGIEISRILSILTPLGGILMISGWILLVLGIARSKK